MHKGEDGDGADGAHGGEVGRTRLYTDGACSGNPGPGGWAWVVPDGAFASGFAPDTTNQRMELQAVLEAVQALPGPLHVVSDSTYVVNCFRDGWWQGWIARGWINSAKKPVANRDIWEPLIELYAERDLEFEWVKGHAGDEWNDVADRLAVEAVGNAVGRSGASTPTDLGSADELTKAVRATRTAAPDGHRLLVAGHRPPSIGGYDPNPTADGVRAALAEIIAAKAEMYPDLVVLSGLRLGAEQLGAEAAVSAGVPFVAVLPYPNPDSVWPPARQQHFKELVAAARSVHTLQRNEPADKAQAGAALARRDAWFAQNAHEAVVVWDGEDAAVGAFVSRLEAALEDDVWVVPPSR